MKMITRNTDYAVRALCYIAGEGKEFVTAAEMVSALRIPRPFLRKILQTLSGEGLLESTKGQGGGFALARPAEKLLLTDLIRIFQGSIQLNECTFKRKACPNRVACELKCKIDSIERYVLGRLSRVSIASLTRRGNRWNRVPRSAHARRSH
jgi:Rrf2 family protein